MFFSVIIPVFNRATCISRAIDSVLRQRFDDFELIIVDDGSTDETLSICREYEKNDKRVKVFHQENKGVSAARNLGLKNAGGGHYVLFLDSDDEFANGALKTIHDAIGQNDNPDIICFGVQFSQNQWKPAEKFSGHVLNSKEVYEYILPEHINIKKKTENSLLPFSCNKCYINKNIIKNNICFDENKKTWEDNAFVVDNLSFAKSLCLISDVLLNIGDSGNNDHLAACVSTHMLDVFILNFEKYLLQFGDRFDFYNEHINRYYFENVSQVLCRIKHAVPQKESEAQIKQLFDNNHVVTWFTSVKPKNRYERALIKAFNNKDEKKLYKTLEYPSQKTNLLISIVRKIKSHL